MLVNGNLVGTTSTNVQVPLAVDSDGKILFSGAVSYQGVWNATTNTPTLSDATGTKGHYYVVSVSGTQDLGSGNITFAVGDWVIFNGTIYEKADHTDLVSSVFGRVGNVVAVANDYTWAEIDKTVSSIADITTRNHTDLVAGDGTDHANVVLNDTHRASDGTDHANVVLNDTHRASDGTDHANVVLNDTHRSGDGSDHADVATNTTHSTGDGSDHADVATNTTHSTGDGSDHANVALNDTHRASDGKDHSDVVLNNTHRASDGKDHSDVVLNNAHRVATGLNVSIPMPGINGNEFEIGQGIKGDFVVPFNCTITGWTLLADQTGSIQIDLWKDTYGNFPPTVADTIVTPTITTAIKNQATGLSIALLKGAIIRVNVDSVTDIERLAWSLEVTRT